MFLSIRELEQEPVRFDLRLSPGAIELGSEFQQKTPLFAVGGASFNDATEEISVQGRIQVGLQMDCNRCLEPFEYDLEEEFDLVYRPSPVELAGVEIAIKASESDVGFYEG